MPEPTYPHAWRRLSPRECRDIAAAQMATARHFLRDRAFAEGRRVRHARLNRAAYFRSVAVSYLREARRLEDRA